MHKKIKNKKKSKLTEKWFKIYTELESTITRLKLAYLAGNEMDEFKNLSLLRYVVLRRLTKLISKLNKQNKNHIIHISKINGDTLDKCGTECYFSK